MGGVLDLRLHSGKQIITDGKANHQLIIIAKPKCILMSRYEQLLPSLIYDTGMGHTQKFLRLNYRGYSWSKMVLQAC